MKGLVISDLHAGIGGKEILQGVNLKVPRGEVHVLMGPNGSGKSTLALTLLGHPLYHISNGKIFLDEENITDTKTDERARRGLFLAFQSPSEISGVTLFNVLRSAYAARQNSPFSIQDLKKTIDKKMQELGIDESFLKRSINEGFSGGEKKRSEILQLSTISPTIAILDEIDSGLDVDALKTVAQEVRKKIGKDLGVLIITHYQRLLHYLEPDFVHVMMNGKIIKSGRKELADEIEEKGYGFLKESK